MTDTNHARDRKGVNVMYSTSRSSRTVGLAVTSAMAAALLAGCATKAPPRADLAAGEAQVALAKGQTGKAIENAEAAVAAEPRNAAYRAMLGGVYLEAGRFASAEVSFDDAMAEVADRQIQDGVHPEALGPAFREMARSGPLTCCAAIHAPMSESTNASASPAKLAPSTPCPLANGPMLQPASSHSVGARSTIDSSVAETLTRVSPSSSTFALA